MRADEAESILRRLASVQVPSYVHDLGGGRDGVTSRFTTGSGPNQAEWVWWGEGPSDWAELVSFATTVCDEFQRPR